VPWSTHDDFSRREQQTDGQTAVLLSHPKNPLLDLSENKLKENLDTCGG